MNKPSWESAPDWANWLAMDGDGTWFWYENKPHVMEESNSFSAEGKSLGVIETHSGWEDSLEEKPTASYESIPSGKEVDGWSF